MKELSLIILAYNDKESLEKLIPEAFEKLSGYFDRLEVIVVDDHGSDDTEAFMKTMLKDHAGLVYHRNPQNEGVGYTFQRGVSLAQYPVVAYTDGDGQYELSDLVLMYPMLGSYDIVSGNRHSRAEGVYRWLISRTFNLMLRILFDLKLKDTNSALKCYKKEVFREILPLKHINGFFDAEILIKARNAGFTIMEMDIKHYSRKFGMAKGAKIESIISIFKSMIRFRYE